MVNVGKINHTWINLTKSTIDTFPETNIFASENGWLGRRSFPFGFRPIFREELLVSGRVRSYNLQPRPLIDDFFHCFFFSLPLY